MWPRLSWTSTTPLQKHIPGNYQAFIRSKVEERERREKENQKREAQIAEHKAFADRFRAKASKGPPGPKQAQGDRSYPNRIPAPDDSSLPPLPFQAAKAERPPGFGTLRASPRVMATSRSLRTVGLTVMRGERVAIIGPNGIGKSTLLKIAMGEATQDSGTVEWGYETYPGYFAQDHKEQIGSHSQTIESWLGAFCPAQGIGYVKGQLAAVLFSGDESEKETRSTLRRRSGPAHFRPSRG